MKTVLFMSPTASIGGAERHLMTVCETLPTLGYTPIVIGPPSGPLRPYLESIQVRYIPWAQSGLESGMIFRVLWNVLLLRLRLVGTQIDIVHSNSIFCMYVAAYLGAILRKPTLIQWADFDTRPGDVQLAKWLPNVHVVAVSRAIRHTLETAGLPPAKLTCRYPTSPTPSAPPTHRTDIALEFGLPMDTHWVAITGRIDTWKGHRYAIEAVATLTHPVTLVILGNELTWTTDPLVPQLTALAATLGIENRVVFTGHILQPERLVQHADIVLCPSDYEPFGLVATEAMALSKPVIASQTGGFYETVQDGITGYLVPPKSSQAIAERLTTLIDNPDLRLTMGRAAFQRYNQLFSHDTHFQHLRAQYDQLSQSR